MAARGFPSGEDVCKIIRTCAESGVLHFKLGPLEFSRVHAGTPPLAPGPTMPGTTPPEHILQEQTKAEKDELALEEIRTREEQLVELQITDPLRFEELLERGELELSSEPDDGGEA